MITAAITEEPIARSCRRTGAGYTAARMTGSRNHEAA
jgi:hypothetical protein